MATRNIVWIAGAALAVVLSVARASAQTPILVYGDSLPSSGLAAALRDATGAPVEDYSEPGSFIIQSAADWDRVRVQMPGKDVVLWQGINDLNQPGFQAPEVLHVLKVRVRVAYGQGARKVIVLPYPLVNPYGARPRDRADVNTANAGLLVMAAESGAIVPLTPEQLGPVAEDGLHIRPEYYPVVASAIAATGAGQFANPRVVPTPLPGQVFSYITEQGPPFDLDMFSLRGPLPMFLWYQRSTGSYWLIIDGVTAPERICGGRWPANLRLITLDLDANGQDDVLAHDVRSGVVYRFYIRNLDACTL